MEVTPYITPPETCLRPIVFIPSDDGEILSFQLDTGDMVQRWRGVEGHKKGRVTCVTGRLGHQVPHLSKRPAYSRNCIPGPLMQKLACGNQMCFINRQKVQKLRRIN